jgi:hypothetical protein
VKSAKPGIWLLVLLFTGGLISCNQDPIFDEISNEVEPKDPLIMGGPTNLVEFNGFVYVASGYLYRYHGSTWWSIVPSPPNIRALAVSGSYLYAQSGTGLGSAVYRSQDGSTWEVMANGTEYVDIQTVFAVDDGASGKVFVGARHPVTGYVAILIADGMAAADAGFTKVKENLPQGGELRGAAYLGGDYYLLTTNLGVYRGTGIPTLQAATALPSSSFGGLVNFNGLKTVGSSVIAVSNAGYIWVQPPGSDPSLKYPFPGVGYTGAMAFWGPSGPTPPAARLLLGTINGDGSYGYREMLLDNGELGNLFPVSPGVAGGSVYNNPQYESSLGRRVVNGIIQVSPGIDPAMPLFASTQKDGLWSYRLGVWNAEE